MAKRNESARSRQAFEELGRDAIPAAALIGVAIVICRGHVAVCRSLEVMEKLTS